MRRPPENWILSCGHTRAMGVDDGPNEPGDSARCYECPAKGDHRRGFTPPMRTLAHREPPSQGAPYAPPLGPKICDEAYCLDCRETFVPTGEEEHDPPEHGNCEGTNTEWRGSWHAPVPT